MNKHWILDELTVRGKTWIVCFYGLKLHLVVNGYVGLVVL
ncbi:MAG: hypothetical protein F6K42_10620 [Leptolyngbya sp. SIO1D8]|nr:hypothetical protein [Leptolyngbya sp. SIO1D8]